MRLSSHILLGFALIITTLSYQTAQAGNKVKSVVIDSNGQVIRSMLSGDCVRTKTMSGQNQCINNGANYRPTSKILTRNRTKEIQNVFFGFGKAELNNKAKQTLKSLANKTKDNRHASFKLIGHADRSGSAKYNIWLSERRVTSVKAALISLGVPKESITVEWKGEDDPLISTADSVAKAKNRRVEIQIR